MYQRLATGRCFCLRRLQFRLSRIFNCGNKLIYFLLVVTILWILSFVVVQQLMLTTFNDFRAGSSYERLSLRGIGIGIKGLDCLIRGNCRNISTQGIGLELIKMVEESHTRHQSYIYKLRNIEDVNLTNYGNVRNSTDISIINKFFSNLNIAVESDTGVDYNSKTGLKLVKEYDLGNKHLPYVEHKEYSGLFSNKTHQYLNSMAVFPGYNEERMHGILGILPNGTTPYVFVEMPPKINLENGTSFLSQGGGFYRQFSDYLPLDREPDDVRDEICKNIVYPIKDLDDASVIITFYNEPLSTLLRSVHSVLNHTPPPLLREIILVDDGSEMIDLVPGGFLDEYIKLLPKVRILHLKVRTGIVGARLHGVRIATAPIIVILDSHIETSKQWLEPQLLRLKESPTSVVMPQIDSIDPLNFSYISTSGIGCKLGFKYSIVEQATLTGKINDTTPIKSPMMAGGLFAIRRDFFWKLGGYDEQFMHWGAENVEFSLRIWLCGGILECTPCSRVFHIFRKKGVGYTSPRNSLWRNRLRTARVWLDDFYQVTELFAPNPNIDLGSFEDMIHLKKKLKCKPFRWFLENIAPDTYLTDIKQILFIGEIRSRSINNICLDTMSGNNEGDKINNFYCHGEKGTQAFMLTNNTNQIRLVGKESYCIDNNIEFASCSSKEKTSIWSVEDDQIIKAKIKVNGVEEYKCLTLLPDEKSVTKFSVKLNDCDNSTQQYWQITKYSSRKYVPLSELYSS